MGLLLFLAKIYVPIQRLLVDMYVIFSLEKNIDKFKIYLNTSDPLCILIFTLRLDIVHNLMPYWNT